MTPPISDEATQRNLLLLVQLRWIAVAGQFATIVAVALWLAVPLPLTAMITVLAVLVAINLAVLHLRRRHPLGERALLATLLVDVACLTAQLWLSGGATNPFVSLYLLQIVLGAVLLPARDSWMLVAITSLAFAALALFAPPLFLPPALQIVLSPQHLAALWFNYTLAAVLIVLFTTRIARNLRDRDARIATLRQRAAEEAQIVRMGLLASGAAHELGTPLASLAVALGDWRAYPASDEEVAEMQAEVARCKEIVAGILFAAGEVSGEAPHRTTLARFVGDIVATATARDLVALDIASPDVAIIADRALAQTLLNLIDNAAEAGATRIAVTTRFDGDDLVMAVVDDGRGFTPEMLADIGQPYRTTKQRRGAGLGLFLASNVMRSLGGTLAARNASPVGAEVTLRLPTDRLTTA